MLRKTIVGALVFVVFNVLASLTFGQTATVTAQGTQAAIWTDKTEYNIGERSRLCYTVPQPAYIEITDILADGTSKVVLSGNDDGRGDCLEGTIEPPTGMETLLLTVSSDGQVIATAETSFRVLEVGATSQDSAPNFTAVSPLSADSCQQRLPTFVPAAQASQRDTKVPASVTLAQLIEEATCGQNHIGDANNYFGVKAQTRSDGSVYYGNIAIGWVWAWTTECCKSGQRYSVQAKFRKYKDMNDSFRDHANFFIENSRYAEAMRHTDDPFEFARQIAKAGYATNPNYANNLIAHINTYNLRQYDGGVVEGNCDGGEGVYLYEHSDYQGRCSKFTSDSPNPSGWSIGNDTASSIRIVGNWTATLYEHVDYQGTSSTFTRDEPYLGNSAIGNDRVSSIRVQRGGADGGSSNCDGGEGVYLYEHYDYQGRCSKFTSDSPNPDGWSIGNDTASSIRIVGNWTATLYEHVDYQGTSSTFTRDEPNLGNFAIGNDRVSSIRVRQGGSGSGNNLARGKPAEASSVERGDWSLFGPSNATDGDTSTRWSSRQQYEGGKDAESFGVSLQGRYKVNKVVLRWEAAYATSYRIYVWFDGSGPVEVARNDNGRGGVETIEFPARDATSIGVALVRKVNPSWGYSLWEFEVYGP